MPVEVIANEWCDPCADEGLKTPGRRTPFITIGRAKPKSLLLCEVHEKQHLIELSELLQRWGDTTEYASAPRVSTVKAAGSTDVEGEFPCPDLSCPKHAEPYTKFSSLRSHLKGRHQMTPSQAAEAFSGQPAEDALFEPAEPETEAAEESAATVLHCEDCEATFSTDDYKRPKMALTLHRRSHAQ